MAASIILVVGIFAAFWMNRTAPVTETPGVDVAKNTSPVVNVTAPEAVSPPKTESRIATPTVRLERASYRPVQSPASPKQPVVKPNVDTASANDYMPGEESYVKTIASLSRTIEEKKDDILRPSQRIAYERDMAVVNDAIAKMRSEVKRNPKNQSARQVLYSSYQNKIDLLNSVSQKEELMASLR
jgi:hypothetical protein